MQPGQKGTEPASIQWNKEYNQWEIYFKDNSYAKLLYTALVNLDKQKGKFSTGNFKQITYANTNKEFGGFGTFSGVIIINSHDDFIRLVQEVCGYDASWLTELFKVLEVTSLSIQSRIDNLNNNYIENTIKPNLEKKLASKEFNAKGMLTQCKVELDDSKNIFIFTIQLNVANEDKLYSQLIDELDRVLNSNLVEKKLEYYVDIHDGIHYSFDTFDDLNKFLVAMDRHMKNLNVITPTIDHRDILPIIFKQLSQKDGDKALANIRLVCKMWNKLINEVPNTHWQGIDTTNKFSEITKRKWKLAAPYPEMHEEPQLILLVPNTGNDKNLLEDALNETGAKNFNWNCRMNEYYGFPPGRDNALYFVPLSSAKVVVEKYEKEQNLQTPTLTLSSVLKVKI